MTLDWNDFPSESQEFPPFYDMDLTCLYALQTQDFRKSAGYAIRVETCADSDENTVSIQRAYGYSDLVRASEHCFGMGGAFWLGRSRTNQSGTHPGHNIEITLCAPDPHCQGAQVAKVVYPHHLLFNAPGEMRWLEQVSAMALGRWASARIDFAIVGFAKCGTHTLGHVLEVTTTEAQRVARHGSGRPSPSSEDYFFCARMRRMLPLQDDIDRFNRVSFDKPGPGRRFRFIQEHPLGIYHDAVLEALSEVPGLRVVVTVRDPVEQFVSFWRMLRRRDARHAPSSLRLAVDLAKAFRQGLLADHQVEEQGLAREVAAHAGLFSQRLQKLHELFAGRLLVVHMDALSSRLAVHYYNEVLLPFLGIGQRLWHDPGAQNLANESLPHGHWLRHFDICAPAHAATLLALRELLQEEYDALYAMPDLRRYRRGACEAPAA